MEIFAVVIILVIIALVAINIRIVPQSKAFVVERLGAYYTTWETGKIHYKIPFIDRVAKTVSLKEHVVDFKPQPVITKDNVTMQIDTVVFFQITDPKLYTYGVESPISAIENLTATTLRNIIGELELDSTLTSRDTINTKIRVILDEATDPWGIKVNRVELKNIIPPKEIQDCYVKSESVKSFEYLMQLYYTWSKLDGAAAKSKARLYDDKAELDDLINQMINNVDECAFLSAIHTSIKKMNTKYGGAKCKGNEEFKIIAKYFDMYNLATLRLLYILTKTDFDHNFFNALNNCNDLDEMREILKAPKYNIRLSINSMDTNVFAEQLRNIFVKFSGKLCKSLIDAKDLIKISNLGDTHNAVKNNKAFPQYVKTILDIAFTNTELQNELKKMFN